MKCHVIHVALVQYAIYLDLTNQSSFYLANIPHDIYSKLGCGKARDVQRILSRLAKYKVLQTFLIFLADKSLFLQTFRLAEIMLKKILHIYFYKYFIKHCKVWYIVSQRCYTHCMYTLRLHIIHRIHEHEYLYGGAQYVHPYISLAVARDALCNSS